jgi:hypothetical protein
MLSTVNSAETNSLMAYFTKQDVALYSLGIGCCDVDKDDGNEKDGDQRDCKLRYVYKRHTEFQTFPSFLLSLFFIAQQSDRSSYGMLLSHRNPWLISLTTGRAAGTHQGDSTGTNVMQITCVTCQYCICHRAWHCTTKFHSWGSAIMTDAMMIHPICQCRCILRIGLCALSLVKLGRLSRP